MLERILSMKCCLESSRKGSCSHNNSGKHYIKLVSIEQARQTRRIGTNNGVNGPKSIDIAKSAPNNRKTSQFSIYSNIFERQN